MVTHSSEILSDVLNFLDFSHVESCQFVCKSWNSIISYGEWPLPVKTIDLIDFLPSYHIILRHEYKHLLNNNLTANRVRKEQFISRKKGFLSKKYERTEIEKYERTEIKNFLIFYETNMAFLRVAKFFFIVFGYSRFLI